MNTDCRRLKHTLVTDGPQALRQDDLAQDHLAACPTCFAMLEATIELDRQLARLRRIDAPQSVVDQVLEQAAAAAEEPPGSPAVRRWPSIAVGSAVAASLLLVMAVWWLERGELIERTPPSDAGQAVAPVPAAPLEPAAPHDAAPRRQPLDVEPRVSLTYADVELPPEPTFGPESPARDAYVGEEPGETPAPGALTGGLAIAVKDHEGSALPGATVRISHETGYVSTTTILTDDNGVVDFPVLRPGKGYSIEVSFPGYDTIRHDDLQVSINGSQRVPVQMIEDIQKKVEVVATTEVIDLGQTQQSTKFSQKLISDLPVPGRYYTNVLTMSPGVQDADGDGNPNVHGSRSRDFQAIVSGVNNVDPLTGQQMSRINPNSIEEMDVITGGAGVEFGRAQGGFARIVGALKSGTTGAAAAVLRARGFLEARTALEGIEFRPARGYWANNYLPGDSLLRLLSARLGDGTPPANVPAARLHRAAHRPSQPFDPPRDAALAVYVHADRPSLNGRTRLLVQVGLQAAAAAGSRRPPRNVALVLDLRGDLPQNAAVGMRALVDAFEQAREPGDQFHLLVAGRPGGLLVEPQNFRHGVLFVTLGGVLGDGWTSDSPTLGLGEALAASRRQLSGAVDSEGPLGSSAIVLITSQPLGSLAPELNDLAHKSAIGGVPVSAIAVGSLIDPAELKALALAGQGSLRLLAAPAEAADVASQELVALSRVVARAVRLRIRLAPAVQLVDVIGSEWLDEKRAERVRQAERSIDSRTSRDLGIASNRGRDEDGIQIVIPNFYAGDGHVVLLDVVAGGPGPIADVQVRYKDLVNLRNGVSRASLDVGCEERRAGPLERNVLKNLLAVELAATLERAGRALASGDLGGAVELLRDARELLGGLPLVLDELASDPDLGEDTAMLEAYVSSLSAAGPADLAYLTDSLRYAARLKVLPPPRVE